MQVGSMELSAHRLLRIVFPPDSSPAQKLLLLAACMFWDRHRWRREFDEGDLLGPGHMLYPNL
jgi:hypothetical protein